MVDELNQNNGRKPSAASRSLLLRMLQYVGSTVLTLVLLAAILATAFYMQAMVYSFGPESTFGGSHVFNPYQNLDNGHWLKANFHTHTNASDGKNTVEEVQAAYKHYNYDILAISDHSVVTPQDNIAPDYEILCYEHGINISKFHSVIFGAQHGSIFDYVLFNTLSHKHDALKKHAQRGDLVVFDHPNRTRWLTPSDLAHLSHYHLMEVEHGSRIGELPYYDAALSNGHYSSVLASDDCHDVNNMRRFARAATFVNAPSGKYRDVLHALRHGYVYAVTIPAFKNSLEYKRYRNMNLPRLERLHYANGCVDVLLSEPAAIRAFGQGGILLDAVLDSDAARFAFDSNEPYIRIAASFPDGVMLFTNPLLHFDGKEIPFRSSAKVDYTLSTLYVASCALVMLLLLASLVWVLRWMGGRCRKSILHH